MTELRAQLLAAASTLPSATSPPPCSSPPKLSIPKLSTSSSTECFLRLKLREEARGEFLQRQSQQLLTNDELTKLWDMLKDNTIVEESSDDEDLDQSGYLDYACFLRLRQKLMSEKRVVKFFNTKTFVKLMEKRSNSNSEPRVRMVNLFNYVMRKVWQLQTRIGISLYDATGNGYLREKDLENYISELLPALPQLDALESSFHNFYTCTAIRKFFFFLDPMRTTRISVHDILACGFLDELLELRDENKETLDSNWFSPASALRVYGNYLSLDQDHNGMLSKTELLKYGTGTLTPIFMDRLFETCLTYSGEMDYKTYLDFVLAMENKSRPQALQFLFRVLDTKSRGYLDAFDLHIFFRDILKQMEEHNHEPVLFEDIKDEIFDMVKPAHPYRITLNDLVASGQGETVVSILIDLNSFWTYENREVLASEPLDQTLPLMATPVNPADIEDDDYFEQENEKIISPKQTMV